jgi:hypothetical protein
MEVHMRYLRHCLAWIAAAALLLFQAQPVISARPPIGILTIATHAYLDEAMAFPGLSVFEGERLSTEPEGRLGVRLGHSALMLGESTEVELISARDVLHVDMTCGMVRFSAAENEPLEVHTGDVLVRPATSQPTQGAIVILAPKVLQITAEHGSLSFRFHQEYRQLPEGQTYRVYLDTPGEPEDETVPVAAGRKRNLVAFFIVGAGAGGLTAWGIGEAIRTRNPPISPARP